MWWEECTGGVYIEVFAIFGKGHTSTLKNVNFSKLFPLKRINHVMNVRNPLKYQLNKANTERYKKSTIPHLQGLLNKEYLKRRDELNDLQTFKQGYKVKNNCRFCSQILFEVPRSVP